MFKITNNRGFHITFANGVKVSVQFGFGAYCQNKDDLAKDGNVIDQSSFNLKDVECMDAEIAVIAPQSLYDRVVRGVKFLKIPGEKDAVKGYCSPEQVLKIMNWAANCHKKKSKKRKKKTKKESKDVIE